MALQHCTKLRSAVKMGMTGTVMQNNITEIFHLVEIVRPGHFGSLEDFRLEYVTPIMEGRSKSASAAATERGKERAAKLNRQLTRSLYLRREKQALADQLPRKTVSRIAPCSHSDVI